ncbi:UPF0754 membrane protein YheB [Salisediminibacterium halotolerans]|nr:UPF0754 membrane protein YheB [Salisediminibacterium halotolerans]
MEGFWIILLLIFIGAVVGGGTNILAIRMIFRPHKPLYIGKARLPFTPGLIPKRRGEIADRLGKMVEEHLLTPEGIQTKLEEGAIFPELERRIGEAVNRLVLEEITIDEWLEENFDTKGRPEQIRRALETAIRNKLTAFVKEYENLPMNETIPPEWQTKINERIPHLSGEIISRVDKYLHSPEGQEQLQNMIDHFFRSKGSMTNMFGRMASRFSLANFVTKEITKFLNEPNTVKMLSELLKSEWDKTILKAPAELFDSNVLSQRIERLTQMVVDEVPIVGEWNKPLNEWSGEYRDAIERHVLPAVMGAAATMLSRYLATVMHQVGIRDVVRRQVNDFPIYKLEEMLVMIAIRELKMIALLGAIIGGLIGLIQGGVIIFFI